MESVKLDCETLGWASQTRGLVREQEGAIRRLAEFNGRVVAVVGPGGAGKTYAIGAYADAAASAGFHLIGVAPTATAAQKLAEDLGGRWTGLSPSSSITSTRTTKRWRPER